MRQLQMNPIGEIKIREEGMFLALKKEYAAALKGLEGFRHIQVLWWFSKTDTVTERNVLEVKKPYKKAPQTVGVFATRAPERPNPIALTTAQVIHIDSENGMIQVAYIDAEDGTPILDIKPYTPSLDRVEVPGLPQWCSHWPSCVEESGEFDWESEFLF